MIVVNGEKKEIDDTVLAKFLEKEKYNKKHIAVELNGQIVPKSEYDKTTVKSGDKLEIVSFKGGG